MRSHFSSLRLSTLTFSIYDSYHEALYFRIVPERAFYEVIHGLRVHTERNCFGTMQCQKLRSERNLFDKRVGAYSNRQGERAICGNANGRQKYARPDKEYKTGNRSDRIVLSR